MKKLYFLFCIICSFCLVACEENNENLGNAVKPEGDEIFVSVDTFFLPSSNQFINSVYLQNDTLLLGEVYHPFYGTTKADVLAQVAPPLNYTYPPTEQNPVVDSLLLFIYYKSWYGASNSPIEISIYELNGDETITYSSEYYSDINVGDYSKKDIPMGKTIMTSIDKSVADSIRNDSSYTPVIRYKLEDSYAQKLFELPESVYKNEEDFLKEFKGLYITSTFGSSTMLNISKIDLRLFYHYTRRYEIDGKEVEDVVSSWINFPANKDVRQLNSITHPQKEDFKTRIETIDSLNFVATPASIYTKVNIPIKTIGDQIIQKLNGKTLSLNRAALNLETVNFGETSDIQMPIPSAMLLVREDFAENYFKENNLPLTNDTVAIIGYYNSSTEEYDFDLSYFTKKYIKDYIEQKNTIDELNMLLIPVDVKLSYIDDSSYITGINSLFKISGVAIRSGQHPTSPIKLKITYSGF